jgi:hypothetical protein
LVLAGTYHWQTDERRLYGVVTTAVG